MRSIFRNAMTLTALVVGITCVGFAQTAATPPSLTASVDPPAAPSAGVDTTHASSGASKPELEPTVEQEIEALKTRIEQLEIELKEEKARALADSEETAALKAAEKELVGANANAAAKLNAAPASLAAAAGPAHAANTDTSVVPAAQPAKDPHAPPFADHDWTWLNGNPRNKDTAYDSKFFTPEIRADITYTYDFGRPMDDTISGSSEIFRSNEIQLEQFGLGGDFHLDNAHARFMTQFGAYSIATIRNDPSYSKGQWDLADALRYMAEAYGGYQIPNIMHGINFDAGIFMSYIGLFSYYNFDNWAYQPSYVSSNTPWFFQGIRIQIFPTQHLKIEPWIINGWQSYGSSNSRKGIGGQIKWTPTSFINVISNNYGVGSDDFEVTGRDRLHTDNSLEVKYFDNPTSNGLDKMAFSLTGDLGCEYGAGVSCHGGTVSNGNYNPKQSFAGYMLYNRFWFRKDLYAVTVGGGQINNPGMYLVLVPPINGETATSSALNSPYFQMNPGDAFKGWDGTVTFDYMPRQWFTWRFEWGIRGTNIPYWNGHGGMTPPAFAGAPWGVNNGQPTQFACMDGTPAGLPSSSSSPYTSVGQVPYGTTGTGAPAYVGAFCGTNASGPHGGVWYPDLRTGEHYADIDLLVKF